MAGAEILDLPSELLVPILVLAADDDIHSLANIGRTCRTLHSLIFDDQTVWQHVHLLKYDDPRLACAFHETRPEYDWRRRVIDRDYVMRVFSLPDRPADPADPSSVLQALNIGHYGCTNPELVPDRIRDPIDKLSLPLDRVQRDHAAPRTFATVLDLCLDLPAETEVSRNIEVLNPIIKSELFAAMCIESVDADATNDSAHHLKSLLFHIHAMRRTLRSDVWNRCIDYHCDPFPEQDFDARPVPKDRTYWYGILCDAWALVQDCFDSHIECCTLAEAILKDDLDKIRTPGIRGLERPHTLSSTDVWDWAGVRGKWYHFHSGVVTNIPPEEVRFTGPFGGKLQYFNLQPVADRDAVSEAYRAKFPRADNNLWTGFPQPQVSDDTPFPPIHYYGYSSWEESQFVFGVVHLTSDSPPEVRWTWAVEDVEYPIDNAICQGIQIGGVGGKRGTVGAWKTWERGTEEAKHVDFDWGSDGVSWIFPDPGLYNHNS